MDAKKAVVKKKKKKWVPIHADEYFGNRLIGEVPVYETQSALGKHVTVNFMTLSGDMKKQHINISFKVVDLKDGKGVGQVVKYYIIPSSLRRFIRKGRNKVTDSFIVKTKDDKFIRIKPMLITNAATHQSVVTNIRVTAKKILQNVISTYTYQQAVEEIVSYKLQKYVRDILHKTYPIKICEIRQFILMDKAPLNYRFEKEEIADIIKKSRTAKKGSEDKKAAEENMSDEEEEKEAEAAEAPAEAVEEEK